MIATTQNKCLILTTDIASAAGATTGDGTYSEGTQITITATPKSGFVFANWTVSGTEVSTSANYTFAAPAIDTTYVANYKSEFEMLSPTGCMGIEIDYDSSAVDTTNTIAYPECYVLKTGVVANSTALGYTYTTDISPAAGVMSGGGQFAQGTEVTLTATPKSGFIFKHWKTHLGELLSTNAVYTFAAPAKTNVYFAVFAPELEMQDAQGCMGIEIDYYLLMWPQVVRSV